MDAATPQPVPKGGLQLSEILNNREYRKEELKKIIRALHAGAKVEDVKAKFDEITKDIGGAEIGALEQELIREGLPESEIKRLCDVHVAVFQDALAAQKPPQEVPGHPVHTFEKENEAIENLIQDLRPVLEELKGAPDADRPALIAKWREAHKKLLEVEKHYSRKENILFPFLEKYGITGPPKVMWGVDDDIRLMLKAVSALLNEADKMDRKTLASRIDGTVEPMLRAVQDMVFKERHVLFPMCLETLTEDEWLEIKEQSGEIGYTIIEPEDEWKPVRDKKTEAATPAPEGLLQFATGALSREEVDLIFSHIPLDITFVDRDGAVRYYSTPKDRIFTRTPAIIGRKVQNCHPPTSVHIVERIIEEMKKGERNVAEFWITMHGRFIYIRYFAVRDADGKYQGVLEVTQDVTRIRELQGQKRLLDDEI